METGKNQYITMEICPNKSKHAPKYIRLPGDISQSNRDPKYYNLAFTSTLDELDKEKFISLQLTLIKMITETNKGAVFQVKTGPDNDEILDISKEDESMFNPPVKEIIIKENKRNFISVHPVITTLSPHEMKKNKKIVKFLDDNKFGLRRHHWFTNEVDVVRPYYILTQDPKHIQQFDVITQLDIPKELAKELSDMDLRIVPAQLQQKKTKKIKKPKSTQAFAIEVTSESRERLFNAVTKHLPPTNNTFLPARLRYSNVQSWNNAVQFQIDHNNHTKIVTIVNMRPDQVQLQKAIQAVPGVYSLTQKDSFYHEGQWKIRIQKNHYENTIGKISELITVENEKQQPEVEMIHFLDTSSNYNTERKEAKAFYNTAAKTFANIQFDKDTNSINVVTPEPKKMTIPNKSRGSYASVVSPEAPNQDKLRIKELEAQLKVETEKVQQLTLQLQSKTMSETSTITTLSVDSIKNEIRDMLREHTTQIKEWVSSQVQAGQMSDPQYTEPKDQHSSLARAVLKPNYKTNTRNNNLDLSILDKLTARKNNEESTPPLNNSTDEISVFSEDENMKDPTSLGKREHRETLYGDDDCGTVYKNSLEDFSDVLVTQPTEHEYEIRKNSALVRELNELNGDRSKRVNKGRDPTVDPQSGSRTGNVENHI